jgi:hypothetical protein
LKVFNLISFNFKNTENDNKFSNFLLDCFNFFESKLFFFIKKKIKGRFIDNDFYDRLKNSNLIKIKEHVKI